jgi:MFS superfamily sulfate permease-like transporter
MNLFSPSRGLLVFTPVFLFSIAGMVLAWRWRWCFPLAPYLIAILLAHSVIIAPYWPGHCYGPRYFSDMSHLFVFFLIPAILYWPKMQGHARTAAASLFLLLAVWGVFVHARGATSVAANEWSAQPVSVDDAPWRVWDWSDPQFLRGL